jgi:hypothetical protein
MNVLELPAAERPAAEVQKADVASADAASADVATPEVPAVGVELQGLHGVFVGRLLALDPAQAQAFVLCPEVHAAQALRARCTVDLHGAHIGQEVTLMFERGAAARPIVTGVLRGQPGWPLPEAPAQVQADGERLIVDAKEQLVLRCGQASITLTRAGKVLIEGAYVSSRSSGVNRIKGGSVQLN